MEALNPGHFGNGSRLQACRPRRLIRMGAIPGAHDQKHRNRNKEPLKERRKPDPEDQRHARRISPGTDLVDVVPLAVRGVGEPKGYRDRPARPWTRKWPVRISKDESCEDEARR